MTRIANSTNVRQVAAGKCIETLRADSGTTSQEVNQEASKDGGNGGADPCTSHQRVILIVRTFQSRPRFDRIEEYLSSSLLLLLVRSYDAHPPTAIGAQFLVSYTSLLAHKPGA